MAKKRAERLKKLQQEKEAMEKENKDMDLQSIKDQHDQKLREMEEEMQKLKD